MSASTIQAKLNSVFYQQETNQFGSARYALLFKPGTYNVDANVGFFTQVAGLGLSPDDVTINGAVHAEADWFDGNATQNFWREAENLSVTPSGGHGPLGGLPGGPVPPYARHAATSRSMTAAGRAAASSPTPRSTGRSSPAASSSC